MLAEPSTWIKTHFKVGLWRAQVVSVADPEARGRVQVRILQLHPASAPGGSAFDAPSSASKTLLAPPGQGVPDAQCPWAESALPFGGNVDEGFLMLPSVGSTVWVGFDQGYTGRPVWIGGWMGSMDPPVEFTDPANIRLIKTPLGHLLLFDDSPNSKRILIATAQGGPASRIRLMELNDSTGLVTIRSGADPSGSKIEMSDTQVTIRQGSGTSVVATATQMTLTRGTTVMVLDALGNLTITNTGNTVVNTTGSVSLGTGASLGVVLDSIIALYNAHVHPNPEGGNTGPPTVLAVAGTHSSATVRAKV